MRSRWNLPIYVAYLAISVVVIGFIVMQIGATLPWQHQYAVVASFSDGADILAGNEVLMNGTRVGHVGSVDVINGVARVQLVIDDTRALPLRADASAEVRKKNLLGETYVDLQRGHAASDMPDGGAIPVSRTVPITEIDQVLAIFDPETVQRVQLLVNALGAATTNNGPNLNAEASTTNQLVTALQGPATELSVRQQQVQDIVLELQRFYQVLAAQRIQVRDEFGTWNSVMAQLAAQEGGIRTTVQQADILVQSLDRLVGGETGNIQSLLSTLPSALSDTNSFLDTTNQIIAAIAPYRQYINDVFPDLNTSFAATDANGNHFWSVYSVSCQPNSCSGAAPAADTSSGGDAVWSAYTPGNGS